jgi:signal transduction histidine kinase
MAAARLTLLRRGRSRWLGRLLRAAILLTGLVGTIAAVAVLGLLVLGRLPTGDERTALAFSAAGAALAALLFQPARAHLERDVLHGLGSRLSQEPALEDVLPELAESLRPAMRLDAAEIWTGSAGLLERTASAPHRGWATLSLGRTEEAIVARAGVSGPAWTEVWLPALVADRADRQLRVVPVANADELLGLVVAERSAQDPPFAQIDERVLADLARQLGLAMRNSQLGSQLHASLDEVRRQADQLMASRARVVSAADAERRRIERDLHDGAQQHLVGLGAKLSLARVLAGSNPDRARALLDDLGRDVETAVEELRELAHGIYPPLLADRGLGEALAAVARRAPVRTRLVTAGVTRHDPRVESTVYFCCLEALQNVGKHAGKNASATVRVWEQEGALLFEVVDDGVGYEPSDHAHGTGLIHMADRLGAIGGSLRVQSARGRGARITGTIPLSR